MIVHLGASRGNPPGPWRRRAPWAPNGAAAGVPGLALLAGALLLAACSEDAPTSPPEIVEPELVALYSGSGGTVIGPDGVEYPTVVIDGVEYLLFEEGAELPDFFNVLPQIWTLGTIVTWDSTRAVSRNGMGYFGTHGQLEARVEVTSDDGAGPLESEAVWAKAGIIPLPGTFIDHEHKLSRPTHSYCGQLAFATLTGTARVVRAITGGGTGGGGVSLSQPPPQIDHADHDRAQDPCPPPPSDPPPGNGGGGGGPGDQCEPGGYHGPSSLGSGQQECCEWVEWGLFVWDPWWNQWVLIDSWWEWECYDAGGGGALAPGEDFGLGTPPVPLPPGGRQDPSRSATLAVVPDAVFPVEGAEWIARRSPSDTWLVLVRESSSSDDRPISEAIEGVRTFVSKRGHEPPAGAGLKIHRTRKPSAAVMPVAASLRTQLLAAAPTLELTGIGRVRSVRFSLEVPGSP